MTITLPKCPPANQGVHQWCYHVFHLLIERGKTREEAERHLHEHSTRTLTSGDIPTGTARTATATASAQAAPRARKPQVKPTYQPKLLESFARKQAGFSIYNLKQKSLLRVEDQTPATFLDALYRPGEHVVLFDVFESQGCRFATIEKTGGVSDPHTLDFLTRPAKGKGAWFLSNPVDGKKTYNARLKKPSCRAEENITAFRYLVIESDKADPDLWIAALVQLHLPIVAVYSSGGKSIHALVRVDADDAADWARYRDIIKPPMVRLGADPTVFSAVRLTRLPACFRAEKSRWQELYYLNPTADEKTPICKLPDSQKYEY